MRLTEFTRKQLYNNYRVLTWNYDNNGPTSVRSVINFNPGEDLQFVKNTVNDANFKYVTIERKFPEAGWVYVDGIKPDKPIKEGDVIQFPKQIEKYRAVIREIGSNDKIMNTVMVDEPEEGTPFKKFETQIDSLYGEDYLITYQKYVNGQGWKYLSGWNPTDHLKLG